MTHLIKCTVFIALWGVIPAWPIAHAQSAQPVALTISTTTPTLNIGKELWVDVALTNNSGQNIAVFRSVGRSQGEFFYTLSMHHSQGSEIPLTAYGSSVQKHEMAPISRILKAIPPGQSMHDRINVSHLFKITSPGTYTIEAERQDPVNQKDMLTSNLLTITITQ